MGYFFSNEVDTDKPYYKVTVTSDNGLLAFGKPWKRDDVVLIQADSDKYDDTKDRNGDSWLDKKTDLYKVELLKASSDSKPKDEVSLEFDEPKEETKATKTKSGRGRPRKSTKE